MLYVMHIWNQIDSTMFNVKIDEIIFRVKNEDHKTIFKKLEFTQL